MGKRNDKPVAPTTSKTRYSIAEACAKILDSDDESLLGNDFVGRAYSKRSIRCCQPDMTNPRPAQVKITKPNDYQASQELRFLGLLLWELGR